MRTPDSVKIINYVEQDYGVNRPPMDPSQRGDERSLECTFGQKKSEIHVHIAERDAAHTQYSLYLLFPNHRMQAIREADLYLTRREMLSLPSLLRAAVRESDKVGMFDRGPSLWLRRETSK